MASMSGLTLRLVSALLAAGIASCVYPSRTARGRVVDEAGVGVPSASIYVHTSKGTPLDRNAFIFESVASPSGEFNVEYTGRLESVFAAAEGYNPSYGLHDGLLTLPKSDEAPIEVHESTVEVSEDEPRMGFSFRTGGVVEPGEADLIVAFSPEAPVGLSLFAGEAAVFRTPTRNLLYSHAAAACDFHSIREEARSKAKRAGEELGSSSMWIAESEEGAVRAKLWVQSMSIAVDARSVELSFTWAVQREPSGTLQSSLDRAEFEEFLPDSNWRIVH
jgi:hypothetical protein